MKHTIAGLGSFLFLLSLCLSVQAQTTTAGWQAHTSFSSVLAVSSAGAEIWAATRGGVFSFDPASGEIARFSVVDGLNSVETRTIAADPTRSAVWIGYGSGVLDRLDTETGAVTSFRDIERASQFASRGINRIVVRGDSLLIATDFGVVVFDPARTEVRDSFTRFGDFSAAITASDVIIAPGDGGESRVWVATAEGLAHAPLGAPNLQDPSTWSTESSAFMTSADDATTVAWFDGKIFVGTTVDLYARRPGGVFDRKFVSSAGITDLNVSGGQLFGSERFNLFSVQVGGVGQILSVPDHQDPTGVAAAADPNSFWVGDAVGGLLRVTVADPSSGQVVVAQTVLPDGPTESQFSDLALGPQSVLWAGGSTAGGSGFHRLGADGAWTAFTGRTNPFLEGTRSFTRVAADGLGNGWAGSEGNGLVRVDPDGVVQRFTPANSSLAPAPGSIDFVITGGVAADSDDNIWVTTRATSKPFHLREADGTWTAFDPYLGDGLNSSSTAYGRIYVDSFDQKWIIVRSEANFNLVRGLMVSDSGASLTDQSDDSFQFFGETGGAGLGLPSSTVTSVVEDRDGLIWVGTASGLAFFINTGIVASDPSARAIWPQWADRARGTFVLFGLSINDIAVDPANRLWVATDQGAWLIESAEGGYELVTQFSVDNSPLFSDRILSVAVDPADGRVFFATDRGLLSYEGDAIAPVSGAQDLFVYPNPAQAGQEVTIEGLVEAAQIRIVTPGGSTIAAFSSRGGRAKWNGLDKNGHSVPSGVYLVIAVGDDGQGTSYGKVAVIR
jgi:TSS9, PorZ, N-terminal beta-propeller domain/Two component regulator propeller